MPSTGRIILVNDLLQALKYLDSQHAPFHNTRLKTLFLEREQKRPVSYAEEDGYFVISKIQISTENEKKGVMDITTKQVYHQFDQLSLQGSTSLAGSVSSNHVSPAKSRYQVAVAQAQVAHAAH